MSIQSLYDERAATPSDISEHMPLLRDIARDCRHITEFGVRSGNSTVAFLAGLNEAGRLVSYDKNLPSVCLTDARWDFHQADTGTLPQIEETDMLFIDTLHDDYHVEKELAHGNSARRWLVFHDTVLFGSRNEWRPGAGIMHPILCFMAQNPHWVVKAHHPNNCGLLILGRRE